MARDDELDRPDDFAKVGIANIAVSIPNMRNFMLLILMQVAKR